MDGTDFELTTSSRRRRPDRSLSERDTLTCTMSDLPSHSPVDQPILNWGNVGIGFSFLLFDSIISSAFGLNIGPALITAGIRCVVQLALVATVLQKIFDADNLWAVGAITCVSNSIFSETDH